MRQLLAAHALDDKVLDAPLGRGYTGKRPWLRSGSRVEQRFQLGNVRPRAGVDFISRVHVRYFHRELPSVLEFLEKGTE